MQKRILYMLLGWLLLFNGQGALAQADTLCNPNENQKLFSEVYFNYGSATNVFSAFNRFTYVVGQSVVSPQNMLSQGFQGGVGNYSAWFLPPQPPILTASQGDFKDRIKISWNVNPLSPSASGFVLFRDGSFLADLGADVREFLDFNTQAGEFYEYSIVAKNVFGTGSPSKFVGFVNPNGVVSGKITTNSGNPVPDVEVRLTPLTGASMSFDGINDQLCVSYNDKFPTAQFTVSAYVKFPTGANPNNQAGIIDWGSGLNKNWWITTTSSTEGKGYIFHIGNGTSSDSLKYILPVDNANFLGNDTKWHQITMIYNGTAMSVMIDGEFIGTKPATIVREKQKLNIGSKSSGGHYKGLLDDVRVYNRPLTQTEVNATKNRAVSKSENGLVAYWKMDEGVGSKLFDNANNPTNANIYGGTAFSTDKPEVYNAGVSDVTGYYIIDGINYSLNESFRATPMKNFEYNSALEFNAADKSYGNLTDYDMPDTSTVEVLFHPFDLKSRQTVLSKGSLYEAYIDNGSLFLNLNGTTTNLGAITAKYYHLAVTLDNTAGSAKVYLEGELKATVSFSGRSNWQNGTPWLLATNNTDAATGKFYTGLVDEFVIYKTALPQNEIQLHYVVGIPQDSTTARLFSYFDLNEGTDTKVYDYAVVNFGAAVPREGTILKAAWSNNARRKQIKPHEFEPNVRVVNLNTSNTAVGNIDFRDVSTVNVSGTVRFSNTFCFSDSIDILVNNQINFPPIRTNKDGQWSADFEPGKTIKLTAQYKGHSFSPGFFEIRKIQVPKAGIVFLNNTKRTIRGQVAGNEKCRKSIIPSGSRVVVKVATLDGCFEKTDTLRNPDGRFVFADLPARAFRVSVVEHSNSLIYNYFQSIGGQEVDLRDAVADTVDFIYVAPPIVETEGILTNNCGLKLTGQGVRSKIKVKIYEQYDGGRCYIDGAKIRIDDPSTGSITDTTLAAGVDTYEHIFYPKNVNITPPYKTVMTITGNVNNAIDTDTTSFIVLGAKARVGTFTSSTPEMPSFVLRDPPGDASYAVLERGSTYCRGTSIVLTNEITEEAEAAISFGGDVTISNGAAGGPEIETTNKLSIKASGGGNQSWVNNSTQQTCITTTKVISTSPGDVVVGSKAGGDVYVGFSENVIYGTADILNMNFDSCKLTLDTKLTINDVRLKGDFVYSEKFVKEDVIPSLELLASQPLAINPKRKQDSIAAVLWKKFIKLNHEDKSTKLKTISFDAGAVYDETYQTEETKEVTETFNDGGFVSAGLSAEINFAGGFEAGFSMTYTHNKEETSIEGKTTNMVINYHLEDDDVGDNFLVNIHEGKQWKNGYIFDLVAGESMCPWEIGTRQRSAPVLRSLDGNTKVNVPANTAAVYRFQIANESPTNQIMNYDLLVDPFSNPNGAVIKVNGQPLTQPITFTVAPNEPQEVTLTLEKGPNLYNYSDIVILLESACETELADARGGDPLIDQYFTSTVNIAAQFIEPCSPVDIGFPLQNFVVTPSSQNTLNITLNEYNKNDEDLKLIRLQYRPIGGDGSWININETPKADLGDVFTIKQWDTQLLKDGPYEIRAVAECFNPNLAPGISTVIKGEVARTPPVVFGVPEPGDGNWDPGDEISITFNENIDCDKVIQADLLGNNTIGLYDATTNALVNATITCAGNKIVITPNINPVFFENRTFRVVVSGKDYDEAKLAENPNHIRTAIRDKAGNMIAETIKWEFAVNQNNLEWIGTDVIEVNEVLKPFSIKRQIRNRGGTITNFRMESVPFWLTVTPSTGVLNPGQVADVTLTFQQDLLIGDYLDTLQLVGSKGKEPLMIDYRVRCPQPKYEVTNLEQYEGTMNMVIDLSIFGIHSKDPSDVIVAKIDGQIRGVGRVQFYRNIPADRQQWLTFLTIYGNASDEDKPIEINVWNGSKCNVYVETLENYTYRDGALEGTPLTPTPVSVLNLVKKSIPLNRGFNWVSFNLDLGTGRNTVKNVLQSLKNKNGAYIKTDNSFAEFLPGYGWDALDTLIYPTKRYMIFVTERDTLTIKGTPYAPADYPIAIKNSWNWVGYVPPVGMTVTQALRGLTPLNGDIIKSQTLFAQFVAGVGWIGNLSFLEPLKGYLLKISNAGTLTYPSVGARPADIPTTDITKGLSDQAELEPNMGFDFTQYEQTMNLIGKINGIAVTEDDELRAYIDGKLVGVNKPIQNQQEMLFFETVYHQDEQQINFKLFKADRGKEFDLDKTVMFKAETVAGMVNSPVVFNLAQTAQPTVTVNIADNVIKRPSTTFPTVSVPASIVESGANCTSYAVSTILPISNEAKPTCTAVTQEGNMSAVIQIKFNERTSFVSANDLLMFVNPTTNVVLGCATFNTTNKLFYATIAGPTGSATSPVDVRYYSDAMKKTFTLKSAITYSNNTRLGNAASPHVLDVSPLSITITNGIISTVMRDTSFVGNYCVNVFAMNCTGYNDGQASYCVLRLNNNDPGPLLTVTPDKPVICPNTSVSLTATGCAGTITWKDGPLTQTGPSATFTPAATTTYFVRCSTGGSTTVDVTVVTTNVMVNNDINTGIEKVKALERIESNKKVGDINFSPAPNVSYEAGKSIELKPGFVVEKNSTFKAEIKGCN
jgi:Concanavalin A-like lectin/glucanases superfamily/Bacterial Ig-like domain